MSVTGPSEQKFHGFLEHVNLGRENLHKLYENNPEYVKKTVKTEEKKFHSFFKSSLENQKIYDLSTHTFRNLQDGEKKGEVTCENFRDFLIHRVSEFAKQLAQEDKNKEKSIHQYFLYKLGVREFASEQDYIDKAEADFGTADISLLKMLKKIKAGKFLSNEQKAQKKNKYPKNMDEAKNEKPEVGEKEKNAVTSNNETDKISVSEKAERSQESVEVKKSEEAEVFIEVEKPEESQESVKTKEKKTHSGISGFFMRIGNGFKKLFASIHNWFKKLFS